MVLPVGQVLPVVSIIPPEKVSPKSEQVLSVILNSIGNSTRDKSGHSGHNPGAVTTETVSLL